MFYRLVDAPNTAEPEPAPDHELSPEKTVMGLLRRANVHIDAINNMLSNEFLALKKHLERMEASLPKSEIHNTYIYHGQHQGGVADVALMLRSVNLADIWKNEVKAKSENESAPEIRPSEKTEMQSDWHRRMTFVPRYESPAKTQPEPAPETRSEADRLREVLNIFRAFVTRNVLKWNEGTCIGHPMWELLTKAIGGEPKIYDGPAWQFIQPDNRERLATLKDRRRSKGDVL
ncbi:MAG: hypothetical protein DI537_20360 [Stutzerimonas stutzeri]|nr:MAG: hypothetical protein DI537_20360 [Stutzerimonas stutzeri]